MSTFRPEILIVCAGILCVVLVALHFALFQWCGRQLSRSYERVKNLEKREIELTKERTDALARCAVAERKVADLDAKIDMVAEILGWEEDDGESPLYACSIVSPDGESHLGFLVRAASRDEAYGKAHRVGKKSYPKNDFSVLVTDTVIEPEA